MNYQVLARKWRPKIFADVVGQAAVLQALQFALKSGRLHHAYLFTGTRGVGKTTLARILAKALSCTQGVMVEPCNQCANCQAIDAGKYLDVLEIDAASRTKVEDTRELLDNVPYAPVAGRYKIYIIDEVHMLSNHSFNALLKTLEEPPAHVKFIFATTDPQKLPVTILSRCLQFQLSNFYTADISKYLQRILMAENLQFSVSAVDRISLAANGSVRDALTLLEQVISLGQENITDAVVAQILGIANHELLLELLTAIIAAQPEHAFACISRIQQAAADFNKVLQELLVLLHKIAVVQVLPDYLAADDLAKEKLLALAKDIKPEFVQLLYQIGLNGKKDLSFAPDLNLGFSMIILRMLTFQPLTIGNNVAKNAAVTQPLPIHSISSALPTLPVRRSQSAELTADKPEQTPSAASMQSVPASEPVTVNMLNASAVHTAEQQGMSSAVHQADQDCISPAADLADQNGIPNWDELIYEMKLVGLIKAIAQHCVITAWKENKVSLTLDPVHTALLQPHHEQKLQTAIAQHFGQPIQLKINLGQVLTETPAIKQSNKQALRQQEAEVTIRNNPHVQEILQTFDAKLERVIVKDEA